VRPMKHVLVAGVTGSLGAEVARLLLARGHRVRGLIRDESRLPADVSLSSKHLGNALIPDTLSGSMDGVDCVFSCVGASVSAELSAGSRAFTSVDTPANLALLEEAQRAGVKRFVYVSAFHNPQMSGLAYIRAHEEVVEAVRHSGLEYSIVRPTGFFSALAELLPMAKKGRLPSFKGGRAKSNPIHEGDLAQVCLEAIEDGPEDLPAGGPDVLTRAEMNSLAFAAVGRTDKAISAPLFALKAAAFCASPFQPRMAQLLAFVAALSENDLVAPVRGTRTLRDYFASRVASGSTLSPARPA
jgi:uncharacterized protein YbjT (DUF2867 family)